MDLKKDIRNGYTEVIIDNDCEFSKLYKVSDILINDFNLNFHKTLDDYDTVYKKFVYKNSGLVLYYNVFLGVSIYADALESASIIDNENVLEIGGMVIKKLADIKWGSHDDGKTIGKKGSEDGQTIIDLQHRDGARITLEKDCRDIPFVVTMGVYGLLMHTHFESTLSAAEDYVERSKFDINKIFEMHEIDEADRNELWQKRSILLLTTLLK